MVAPGYVGVRAQAAFEIVLSNAAEQRIVRVALGPMRLCRECRGKLQQRYGFIETCAKEKRDGDALDTSRRRDDAMQSSPQIAVGSELQ